MASLTLSSSKSKNKARITLVGITGAGKSTVAEKIKTLIEHNGGRALIVSADKHSKRNIKGKQLQNIVNKEIRDFDSSSFNGLKIIIMDLCNEHGIQNNQFNFNFNQYNDIIYYPNFNKDMVDEYEAWCLQNVLSRPKDTPQSNYWLNPVGAGLATCIKVHKSKNNGFRHVVGCRPSNNNFNETDSRDIINRKMNEKAGIYANYLATLNLNDEVAKLLSTNNLLR